MPIQPGITVGSYQVEELIGQGAMGAVFRAHHAGLNRPAAIKILQALVPDPEAQARFQLEAQAIAQLRHPNILTVFDFGEYEGIPYMVVEYVPGGSLADRLRGGPAPPAIAVAILRGVAAALDHAHSMGIVHRDVKPANVLIQNDGSPVLADFGLAKLLLSTGLRTMTGTTTGTPAYMAPEQATGSGVGPPADRYALAVVAYQMLTGSPPFAADGPMELLYAHVHRDPPPPGLGPQVDAVILRGLAKDPSARWESCTAMVEALEQVLKGQPLPAPMATAPVGVLTPYPITPTVGSATDIAMRPPTAAIAPPPRRSRRRFMWIPAITVGLIVLATVALAAYALRPRPGLDPVEPNPVVAGSIVHLSGHHMPANTDGSVRWNAPGGQDLLVFQSDSTGAFTIPGVPIPRQAFPGRHLLYVCWRETCPLSAAIQVLAPPTPTPTPTPTPSLSSSPSSRPAAGLDIVPSSPRLGGSYTINATGLTPRSRASVGIVQSGKPFSLAADQPVTPAGTLSISGSLPQGLKAGDATLRVCEGSQGSPTCLTKPITIQA